MGHTAVRTASAAAQHRPQIIMHFSAPPSVDDVASIAAAHLETLPDELLEKCNDLQIVIEELPDAATEQDMNLEDPYELLALFKAGSEITPGVTRKSSNADDTLVLYRRSILDLWCENGDDLNMVIRQVMIGEIAEHFEFAEDQIEEMTLRHFQGLL